MSGFAGGLAQEEDPTGLTAGPWGCASPARSPSAALRDQVPTIPPAQLTMEMACFN